MPEQKYKVPQSVKNNAKRGLEIRKSMPPSQRGGTAVGVARAVQLSNNDYIDLETIKRMFSFLSRHAVDLQSKEFKEKGWKSKGGQAFLLWGSKSALEWTRRIVEASKD